MRVKAQITMVLNLDKCIGCHTCSVTCKNTWTKRDGVEYVWFNNVETKPGVGYPIQWENQEKWKGGWELKGNGKLQLKQGGKLFEFLNIFHNPNLPTIDDYYEPWTYDYEHLFNAPKQKHQPVARAKSLISGEKIDIKWGPNWEDDLAGAPEHAVNDPNIQKIAQEVRMKFEETFFFYLPRLCEHCLNPACVAACPSGALYKRNEDGIVLVDQDNCRGWRYCISACPYKKVYFNWATQKAEKCTFCFPRIEAGLPTICSETCVGKIRYIGVILYDPDKLTELLNEKDDKKLYEKQLEIFLDPNDPKVIEQAKKDGVPDNYIEFAQKSPVYKLMVKYKVALSLHPEFRTFPMVWYVPPISPILQLFEDKSYDELFSSIDEMRIPLEYLANLLTGGNVEAIKGAINRLVAVRYYMRAKELGKEIDTKKLEEVGLSPEGAEELYRMLAIAKFEERFVIPTTRKEFDRDVYKEQGMTGFDYTPDCDFCLP
ncbi:MAG: nitrate reductase subunit beta [Hydrogenothermus sp.]|nr:MAG: nitrate reductase subunit beta [Hydrogenothermus sp.]